MGHCCPKHHPMGLTARRPTATGPKGSHLKNKQNKGRNGTNHGLFRYLKTVRQLKKFLTVAVSQSVSHLVSQSESFKKFQKFSEDFRNFQKFSEIF